MTTVTLAPGDHNLNGQEVTEQIAPRKRAKVYPAKAQGGTFVDSLLVFGDTSLVRAENLGRMGSDAHDAIVWRLRTETGHFLNVVTWNVYVHNPPKVVQAGMDRLARLAVDVVSLQEVSPQVLRMLEGWAGQNGYWIKAGPEEGDICVVLVAKRPERVLLRRGLLRMRSRWVGPKLGKPQAPRVFPVLKFRDGYKGHLLTVRATSLHGPTGGLGGPNAVAVAEYCRKVRKWVRRAR